ncbi:FMN-binding protein [Treponema sp. OMZ 840]|uniref:FMN-binding protein n=1 Tax=Treponema sp. OMZ 840 TaxID=244313 RepID=UPI003D8F3401
MNEQKISRISTVVYAVAASAVIIILTVCGTSSGGVTVQSSAEGYKGAITVEVTAANGKIKTARLVSTEDSDFTKSSIESIIAQAVKNGGTANLDIVSGATYSSKATIKALNEALEKAKAEEAQAAQ